MGDLRIRVSGIGVLALGFSASGLGRGGFEYWGFGFGVLSLATVLGERVCFRASVHKTASK